jgi:hypothetical protein
MQTAVSKLFEGAAAFQADFQEGYYFGVHAAFLNASEAVESIAEVARDAYEETVSLSGGGQPT